MATFYKYKEREDISKSMIDWSGITKEISDNLMKEKNRRDDLKLKIEEDQAEKLKAIDEYAKGLDPTMNQAMIKYAQNYKDYLLNSHKLMKNGLVSVNDTKIKKQGAMDTFNALNDVTKVYNEKIGAFLETGGSLNEFVAGNVAGALDIRKSQLMIDDMGRGSFVTLDENGNEVIVPVTSINTILNDKYDRFDTTGEVVTAVKGITDEWTKTYGAYRSVNDLRQRDEYDGILNSKVDSILNSDKKILEAAADMMDMKVTYDEKLVKENPDKYILAKNQGGKIIFDAEKVKKQVKERLKGHIDAAIGRTEKETPYVPTADERNRSARARDEKQTFSLITSALQGNASDLQSLANTYKFKSVQRLENGKVKIINKEGDSFTIDPKNGIRGAGANFAAALLGGTAAQKYKDTEKTIGNVSSEFYDNTEKVDYVQEYVEPTKVNTSDNISKLNNSYRYKDYAGEPIELTGTQKINAFRDVLNSIIGPSNVTADIDANGNVTIDGYTIEKGIDKAPEVLKYVEDIINNNVTTITTDGLY